MQQEILRNCCRENRKILRKHPVTPKIRINKPKLREILCWTKINLLLNEDIFVEDIVSIIGLMNKLIDWNLKIILRFIIKESTYTLLYQQIGSDYEYNQNISNRFFYWS